MFILKGLIQSYKTNKKDFIYSCLFVIVLMVFLYFGMLLASFIDK